MPILNIKVEQSGLAGVNPKLVYLETNDPIATVLSTGYLNSAINQQNITIRESDLVLTSTKESASDPVVSNFYSVVFSDGNWTLVSSSAPGEVILPTTADHIATYTNEKGTLSQDPSVAITGGDLQVLGGTITGGTSTGTPGELISHPAVANTGSLRMAAGDNSGNFSVTIKNGSHGQNTTYEISDAGVTTGSILVSDLPESDPGVNCIRFSVQITSAELASGGSEIIINSSGTKSYKIFEIFLNSGGTAFSGGGGDRGAELTDGTNVWSSMPASSLTAPDNDRWGSTAVPYPSSINLNRSTAFGQNWVMRYAGGTTDYTTGAIVINGLAARVS